MHLLALIIRAYVLRFVGAFFFHLLGCTHACRFFPRDMNDRCVAICAQSKLTTAQESLLRLLFFFSLLFSLFERVHVCLEDGVVRLLKAWLLLGSDHGGNFPLACCRTHEAVEREGGVGLAGVARLEVGWRGRMCRCKHLVVVNVLRFMVTSTVPLSLDC